MKILIENLIFETIIGILDHERTTPQRIQIDCEIEYTYTNTNSNFINYAEVTQLIENTMHAEQFELIETALESLSKTLKHNFPLIKSLVLTLRKPNILPNCTVGVQKNFIF